MMIFSLVITMMQLHIYNYAYSITLVITHIRYLYLYETRYTKAYDGQSIVLP